jgi:hypothetical protein
MTIQDLWTIEELDFYTWCVSGVLLHWNPTSWETNNLMSELDTYCDMQVASCITVMQEHARNLKHRPRIATPSWLPLSNKSICSKHSFREQTNTITKCVVILHTLYPHVLHLEAFSQSVLAKVQQGIVWHFYDGHCHVKSEPVICSCAL